MRLVQDCFKSVFVAERFCLDGRNERTGRISERRQREGFPADAAVPTPVEHSA